ncbi:hypothetical protein Acr_22g0009180 [Actinidia rufa]|uniref:Uncharacterized protein n=1 Tax=Actinidia rufa TaxID=165716 RepID=A0A7J0GL64_9ERIC|nr:hypothetical protein Acr_22g0009180 [Actinidia rufa]
MDKSSFELFNGGTIGFERLRQDPVKDASLEYTGPALGEDNSTGDKTSEQEVANLCLIAKEDDINEGLSEKTSPSKLSSVPRHPSGLPSVVVPRPSSSTIIPPRLLSSDNSKVTTTLARRMAPKAYLRWIPPGSPGQPWALLMSKPAMSFSDQKGRSLAGQKLFGIDLLYAKTLFYSVPGSQGETAHQRQFSNIYSCCCAGTAIAEDRNFRWMLLWPQASAVAAGNVDADATRNGSHRSCCVLLLMLLMLWFVAEVLAQLVESPAAVAVVEGSTAAFLCCPDLKVMLMLLLHAAAVVGHLVVGGVSVVLVSGKKNNPDAVRVCWFCLYADGSDSGQVPKVLLVVMLLLPLLEFDVEPFVNPLAFVCASVVFPACPVLILGKQVNLRLSIAVEGHSAVQLMFKAACG